MRTTNIWDAIATDDDATDGADVTAAPRRRESFAATYAVGDGDGQSFDDVTTGECSTFWGVPQCTYGML